MSEKKADLKTEIDAAFKLVSAVSVSGDVVDIVSKIRAHLREAYRLAEAAEKKEGPNNG